MLCNISAKTYVQEPNAVISYLITSNIDPANKNCAAFWPRQSGWHRVVSQSQELAFYVRNASEAPGLKANDLHEATLLLTAGKTTKNNAIQIPVPGSPMPWFSVWLLITFLLWLLERSKLGTR